MSINASVDFNETVSAHVAQAKAQAIDLTAPMRRIAGFLVDLGKESFDNQASPLGVPWKPSKRALDEGGMTLVDRGDLLKSLRADAGPTHAAAGPERSGGAAIYAAIHQFGGRIAAKNGKALNTPFGPRGAVTMPARPYLGWTPAAEGHVIDILAGAIAGAMGGGAGAGGPAA